MRKSAPVPDFKSGGPVEVPHVDGDIGSVYLSAALQRAGRSVSGATIAQHAPLSGGRTGATVTGMRTEDGRRFVLKVVKRDRGMAAGLGNDGEATFWLAGCTRHLPEPLTNPTFDVAWHREREEWWILQDDVSDGIVGLATRVLAAPTPACIPGCTGIPNSVSITVTETNTPGYLTVFPATDSLPTTSGLNWSGSGATIPNLVTVQVGTNGSIRFHNGSSGTTQVVADIAGYYLGS